MRDGNEYLDAIFPNIDALKWHGKKITWKEYEKHLDQTLPEHKMLKREIEFIDSRTRKYFSNK